MITKASGRPGRLTAVPIAVVLATVGICGVAAQNVVDPGPVGQARRPMVVTEAQAGEMLALDWAPPAPDAAVRREVEAFCAGHPWRPFHSVLGISGFETYFTHPDEVFLVLSLAGPQASPKLRPLLLGELQTHPPYAEEGFAFATGAPRELYDVPAALLPAGRGRAGDLLGVYAYALFCQRFDHVPGAIEIAAVRARVQPVLDAPYSFDIHATDARGDEPEHLNGDLAGLIGAWRLVHRFSPDPAWEQTLFGKIRELLELRLNLERVNPRPWTPTRFASKSLHNGKLARYLRLTPELGMALRKWTEGAAPARLAAVRKRFSTWWITRGDRLVGGENYTSPLHFSRALWQATAWCDDDPSRWQGIEVDIPWCRGDLCFLERLILRAGSSTTPVR